MELSKKLNQLYAVHQLASTAATQPELLIIPSLFDLAVASLMPQFLQSECAKQGYADDVYAALVQRVPDDISLAAVINITSDEFWAYRGYKHFNYSNCTKSDYLSLKLAALVKNEDAGFSCTEGELLQSYENFIEWVSIEAQADTFNFDILSQFSNLRSIKVRFVKEPVQWGQEHDMPVSEPAVASKSLHEIAQQNCVERDEFMDFLAGQPKSRDLEQYYSERIQQYKSQPTAFPFHRIQLQQAEGVEHTYNDMYTQLQAVPIASQMDIARIASVVKQAPKLQSLDLQATGLSYEGSNLLCEALRQLQADYRSSCFKTLDLSYNYLTDGAVEYLAKLQLAITGKSAPGVERLYMKQCNITPAGADLLARGLGMGASGLRALDLSCNAISIEGFVLLINGVLKSAVKYGNKALEVLKVESCGIHFAEEHFGAVSKLLSETGVKQLSIFGNYFESDELRLRILALSGVHFE